MASCSQLSPGLQDQGSPQHPFSLAIIINTSTITKNSDNDKKKKNIRDNDNNNNNTNKNQKQALYANFTKPYELILSPKP